MGKAILIILAAAALGGAILMNSAQLAAFESDKQNSAYESGVVAREIARSAFNMGVARAKREFESITTTSYNDQAYQDGTFDLAYRRISQGTLEMDVTGRYQDAEHHISTTLMMASPLDAAIVVEAPAAEATFGGQQFQVVGLNSRPPSSAVNPSGTHQDKHGVKANLSGVRDAFRTALGGERVGRVRGVEGDGDIVSGAFDASMQDLYQEAKARRDQTIDDGSITGNTTFGSPESPQIVVIEGDAGIQGNVSGYGMLVVDGNLSISGSFSWEGIVMAKKEQSLAVNLGGSATIYGSLVLLQGSAAFNMPVTGQLQVKYLYSDAGYQSAVYVHPYGDEEDEMFPAGSNRNGDQMDVYERVFPAGTQMNFFIRTYAASGNPREYNHYARGQEAPDGTPYAIVTQLDQYKWKIEFEDLNIESGHRPDWDYNDQVIEVTVIPTEEMDAEEAFEPWWAEAGVEVMHSPDLWADVAGWLADRQWGGWAGEAGAEAERKVWVCHIPPGNPENAHTIRIGESAVEAHLAHGDYRGECDGRELNGDDGNDDPDSGDGQNQGGDNGQGGQGGGQNGSGGQGDGGDGEGGGAVCGGDITGSVLCFNMSSSAQVFYSAEAIARLAPRLNNIREATRVVMVDRWVGAPQE